MPNNNKSAVSREEEFAPDQDFAQELLRAREIDYSPDGSLPWEGRKEDYYSDLDKYSEEEVQELIDDYQLGLARKRLETEEKEQEQEKDKDYKSDRKSHKYKTDNKEEESNKQQRKKQKLDNSETNKALTK